MSASYSPSLAVLWVSRITVRPVWSLSSNFPSRMAFALTFYQYSELWSTDFNGPTSSLLLTSNLPAFLFEILTWLPRPQIHLVFLLLFWLVFCWLLISLSFKHGQAPGPTLIYTCSLHDHLPGTGLQGHLWLLMPTFVLLARPTSLNCGPRNPTDCLIFPFRYLTGSSI